VVVLLTVICRQYCSGTKKERAAVLSRAQRSNRCVG
jgi:hypothetical protein